MITQEQYLELIEPLTTQCQCASPKFQKLVSFNFQDYSISPTSLWDSEILIQKNVRERFTALDDWSNDVGESYRRYECPICKRVCRESYAEYSINMYRSYLTFEEDIRAEDALYLTGLRGFNRTEFESIKDFTHTTDQEAYLNQFHPKSEPGEGGNGIRRATS